MKIAERHHISCFLPLLVGKVFPKGPPGCRLFVIFFTSCVSPRLPLPTTLSCFTAPSVGDLPFIHNALGST